MIDLTEPVDFDAAIDKLSSKELLPTTLRSEELMWRMDANLRDRSFFSAQVANASLLQDFKDAVNEIVTGKENVATKRWHLKQLLDGYGYHADPDKVGTLEDLRSDERLNLILKTNTEMVQGYGNYQQDHQPNSLIAFPAQELVRVGQRKVPRPWKLIWDNARLILGDATTALPASIRTAALKGDPIWTEISDFGLPWPPFKFNSGMGTENIDYDEALDLGLVHEQPMPSPKPTAPPLLPMNHGLAASVAGIDKDLIGSLMQTLLGFSVVGTEVVIDDSMQNRSVAEVWEDIA